MTYSQKLGFVDRHPIRDYIGAAPSVNPVPKKFFSRAAKVPLNPENLSQNIQVPLNTGDVSAMESVPSLSCRFQRSLASTLTISRTERGLRGRAFSMVRRKKYPGSSRSIELRGMDAVGMASKIVLIASTLPGRFPRSRQPRIRRELPARSCTPRSAQVAQDLGPREYGRRKPGLVARGR